MGLETQSLPVNYVRQFSAPLDIDQVFTTTTARTSYLTSPRRYAGQISFDLQTDNVYYLNADRSAWIMFESGSDNVPGGSTNDVQVNNGDGTFGGSDNFKWNGSVAAFASDIPLGFNGLDDALWNISRVDEYDTGVITGSALRILIPATTTEGFTIDSAENTILQILGAGGDLYLFGSGTNDGTNTNTTLVVSNDGQLSTYVYNDGNWFPSQTITNDGSFTNYVNNNGSSFVSYQNVKEGEFQIFANDGTVLVNTFDVSSNGTVTITSLINGTGNETFFLSQIGFFEILGDGGNGDGTGFSQTFQVDNYGQISSYSNIGGTTTQMLNLDSSGQFIISGDGGAEDGTNFVQTLQFSPYGELFINSNINGIQNNTINIGKYGQFSWYGDGGNNDGTGFSQIFNIDETGSFTFYSNIAGNSNISFSVDSEGDANFYSIIDNVQNGTLQVQSSGDIYNYSIINGVRNNFFEASKNGFYIGGDGGANDGTSFEEIFGINRAGQLSISSNIGGLSNQTLNLDVSGDFRIFGDGGAGDGTSFIVTFSVDDQGRLDLHNNYHGIDNATLTIDASGTLLLSGDGGSGDGTNFIQTLHINPSGEFFFSSNIDGISNMILSTSENGGLFIYGDASIGDGTSFVNILELDPSGQLFLSSNISGIANNIFNIDNQGNFIIYGDGGAGDGTGFQQVLNISNNGSLYLSSNIGGLSNQTFEIDSDGRIYSNVYDGSSFNLFLNTYNGTNGVAIAVGDSTNTPNNSALLDLGSTTMGFLPPRMTTTQRLAISTPAEGLIVYDLTLHQEMYFNGTVWISIVTTSSGTYTPTLTNVTNISSSTANQFTWSRVGNIVNYAGSITVTTTLAIASEVDFSLPISSAFASGTDLNGSGTAKTAIATNIICEADDVNDRGEVEFIGLSVGGTGTIFVTGQYIVK